MSESTKDGRFYNIAGSKTYFPDNIGQYLSIRRHFAYEENELMKMIESVYRKDFEEIPEYINEVIEEIQCNAYSCIADLECENDSALYDGHSLNEDYFLKNNQGFISFINAMQNYLAYMQALQKALQQEYQTNLNFEIRKVQSSIQGLPFGIITNNPLQLAWYDYSNEKAVNQQVEEAKQKIKKISENLQYQIMDKRYEENERYYKQHLSEYRRQIKKMYETILDRYLKKIGNGHAFDGHEQYMQKDAAVSLYRNMMRTKDVSLGAQILVHDPHHYKTYFYLYSQNPDNQDLLDLLKQTQPEINQFDKALYSWIQDSNMENPNYTSLVEYDAKYGKMIRDFAAAFARVWQGDTAAELENAFYQNHNPLKGRIAYSKDMRNTFSYPQHFLKSKWKDMDLDAIICEAQKLWSDLFNAEENKLANKYSLSEYQDEFKAVTRLDSDSNPDQDQIEKGINTRLAGYRRKISMYRKQEQERIQKAAEEKRKNDKNAKRFGIGLVFFFAASVILANLLFA